ncbi:hypothetical protein F5I97DRAFT_1806891 [Phlebopus sp. FC_14]|nr:hypothetical protein F5I97DRAFT_1806891 [Phlebopus sp. FC_14]
MRHPPYPRSSVLVFGPTFVQALLPSALIAQVECLLENGKPLEAAALLDRTEVEISTGGTDETEAETFQYLHQCIAFTFFRQTRFKEATQYFVKGKVDPRVLIFYFDELRSALFDVSSVEVWAGVAQHMPHERNIDDIIATNLVRNYSPYLRQGTLPTEPSEEPSSMSTDLNVSHGPIHSAGASTSASGTRTHTATIAMREGLRAEAEEMLRDVLVKILVDAPEPTMVPALRTHVVAVVLAQVQLWGALVEMWKATGDAAKFRYSLGDLVDGTHIDPSVPDPLGQIFTILGDELDRRALIKQWGAWLAERDVEKGMNPVGVAGRTVKEKEREQELADELAILSELKAAEANDKHRCTGAAKRYLEWLTVGRAWEYRPLQDQLVQSCVDELLDCLKDEVVVKLWRAKARSSPPSTLPPSTSPIPPSSARSSFLSYFASTTPDSPSKRIRIKTLLVLQAMATENAEGVKKRIVEGGCEKVLGLEMAVLSSKLSSSRTTFRILHALRDGPTAEAYALSGGSRGVVSARAGVSVAEGCRLSDWARWFGKCAEGGLGMERETKVSITSREMLRVLVEVYIEEGDVQQASRLLSSQGAKLDAAAIISLVPTSWPLHSLTPFLTYSFRYMLHTAHEAQIVKAISAGQNLSIFEQSYDILRDEGAIIEEALSDDEEGAGFEKVGGGGRDDTESCDEKESLKQETGLHLESQEFNVVSVHR